MKSVIALLWLGGLSLLQAAANVELASFVKQGSFNISGASGGDNQGYFVSNAGDVNSDGYDDIIVSSYRADPLSRSNAGIVYVIFGGPSVNVDIDLSTFTSGVDGFKVLGRASSDQAGVAVGAAGDVNGDGIDDVIIGANFASPPSRFAAGITYVIFGQNQSTTTFTDVDLSTFTTGSAGLRILGASAGGQVGWGVGRAGDVNGDGIDDIITGAVVATTGGRSLSGIGYVIFGKNSFSADVDLQSWTSGPEGFRMFGSTTANFGTSVSGAGDVNGDGFDDVIFGAHLDDPSTKNNAGSAFVIYGKNSTYADLDADSFTTGVEGFQIIGSAAGDRLGISVRNAGDFNADGFDDIIVGAHNADPSSRNNAGAAYIIFGRADIFSADIDLSTFTSSNADGVVIQGAAAGDNLGYSVSGAGDVNGDDISDVVVGAYAANSSTGISYVIFGDSHTTTTFADIDLSTFATGNDGIIIVGAASGDNSGFAVSGAGDFNSDGYDDILIGASQASPFGRTSAGSSYLVTGSPPAGSPTTSPTTSTTTHPSNTPSPSAAPSFHPSGILLSEGKGSISHGTTIAAIVSGVFFGVVFLVFVMFVCRLRPGRDDSQKEQQFEAIESAAV